MSDVLKQLRACERGPFVPKHAYRLIQEAIAEIARLRDRITDQSRMDGEIEALEHERDRLQAELNALTVETAQATKVMRDEIERLGALTEAAKNMVAFDQGPGAAKRPDVYALRMRALTKAVYKVLHGGKDG